MNRTIRKTLFLGAMTFLGLATQAQVSNSLFFMNGVPQSNRVNPAYQPMCGLYLGFPLLSPARFESSSSAFSYGDVIYPHPVEDSLISVLHPLGNKKAFLDLLKPVNFMTSDLGTSLASFGFRTTVGFFSLDVTSRGEGNLYYPGDLPRLMLEGTEDGETYELDGIGLDLTAYDEVAVGWSGAILDNLIIGARAKVLFGVANLSTLSSRLSVTTSQEAWNIRSDLQVNASLPFADVVYNEEGMIDSIIINGDLDELHPRDISKYAFNGRNLGFGIDLGADFWPIDQLRVSISLLDLGYIRWTDEVHQFDYTMEYDYPGLEVNPFELTEEYTLSDHIDSSLSQLADSLAGFVVFTPGRVYSERLNTKLFVGASYDVLPAINFGILSRTDFLNGRVSEQVTASANFRAGRSLSWTLSYSYMNAYFRNIGTGLAINLGPMNLYMVSDNAFSVLFWPEDTRSANLWFGMNMVFGYKKLMGSVRDRPLIY